METIRPIQGRFDLSINYNNNIKNMTKSKHAKAKLEL